MCLEHRVLELFQTGRWLHQVQREQQVPKVYQVLLHNLAAQVPLVQQVPLDHVDQQVLQAIKVLMEPAVLQDQLVRLVLQVLVLQALLALKVHKVT
jgi:hypothetical protein